MSYLVHLNLDRDKSDPRETATLYGPWITSPVGSRCLSRASTGSCTAHRATKQKSQNSGKPSSASARTAAQSAVGTSGKKKEKKKKARSPKPARYVLSQQVVADVPRPNPGDSCGTIHVDPAGMMFLKRYQKNELPRHQQTGACSDGKFTGLVSRVPSTGMFMSLV